jgi:hypothetical protein
MSSKVHLLIAIAVLALSACGKEISTPLPTKSVVYVVSGDIREEIAASDPRHQQLIDWLSQNRDGWSQMYATNPSGGILVSSGAWHLQFFGTSVFVTTGSGMFTKTVKESEYAFLKPATGT